MWWGGGSLLKGLLRQPYKDIPRLFPPHEPLKHFSLTLRALNPLPFLPSLEEKPFFCPILSLSLFLPCQRGYPALICGRGSAEGDCPPMLQKRLPPVLRTGGEFFSATRDPRGIQSPSAGDYAPAPPLAGVSRSRFVLRSCSVLPQCGEAGVPP